MLLLLLLHAGGGGGTLLHASASSDAVHVTPGQIQPQKKKNQICTVKIKIMHDD